MVGYLIDPFAQTVTPVEYDGDYRSIYKLIGCSTFTVASSSEGLDCYVDDEGLLNGPTDFFVFEDYPQPLAGKGLVLSHDEEGDSVGALRRPDVRFVRPVMYGEELLWLDL